MRSGFHSMKRKIKDNLFFLMVWKRNFKNRNVIREQTIVSHKVLDDADEKAQNIFFLCVPMHKNMGDQAQRYCIEKWIRENYPCSNVIAIPTWPLYDRKFKKRLKSFVKPTDMIVIQSGYCTTDQHKDHIVHKFVVKNFPNNKILIMPQTVNFFVDRNGFRTGRIYDRHSRLLFLARDQKSYESARRYMPKTSILLYPDIVTTLIGTINLSLEKTGVLLCVRNDSEKKYSDAQIRSLKEKFLETGMGCDITDTNSDLPLDELISNFESEFIKTIELFASHQVVITDRYHGTIFSMIANVPVIVLETNDHKVKTGTEWFQGIFDGSYFNAGSMDEAYQIARRLVNENCIVQNPAYFKKEYYDKLRSVFEETVGND